MKLLPVRIKKRFSARGESMVETLAAVVICSLAVLMLYTALASAARMNAEADARDVALREDALIAELQLSNSEDPLYETVSVAGFDQGYAVEYYVGEGESYISYRML